ncbi:MAG: substrate-binding domain-containing protein [Bacteroidetes bacterium]|nr:substrate-binding domain-containing protein [Bacteroidota bacterium]
MRIFIYSALIILFLGCGTEEKETTTRGRLHFIIPESIAPLMINEVEIFLKLYKENGAEITYTIASIETAASQFVQDTGRIAFLPRPLTEQEIEIVKAVSPNFNELIVAYDGIVIVVNQKNEFSRMSTTEIQKIISGKITRWEQLSSTMPVRGTIKIYCQDSSDDLEFLRHRLLKDANVTAKINKTLSDEQTIQSVENDPISLGIVALNWVNSAKSQVKIIELGRTKEDADTSFMPPPEAIGKYYSPHPAYIHLNYYPLKRAIYLYTRNNVDLAAGFGTYVATSEGQKIILDHGLLPGTQKIKLKSAQP